MMQPSIFILVGCACSLATYIAPNTRAIGGVTAISAVVIMLSNFIGHYGLESNVVSIVILLSSYVASTVVFWIAIRAWQESPALEALRRLIANRSAHARYGREG